MRLRVGRVFKVKISAGERVGASKYACRIQNPEVWQRVWSIDRIGSRLRKRRVKWGKRGCSLECARHKYCAKRGPRSRHRTASGGSGPIENPSNDSDNVDNINFYSMLILLSKKLKIQENVMHERNKIYGITT